MSDDTDAKLLASVLLAAIDPFLPAWADVAQRGFVCDARMILVFPPTTIGASAEHSPSRLLPSGATTPTTPVGSGMEKLKCGVDTGFTLEKRD